MSDSSPPSSTPLPLLGRWWFRAGIASALLLATLHIGERQYGEWAWRSYKKDAEKRGVKLWIADFVPPEIPDEDNFAHLLQNLPAGKDASDWKLPDELENLGVGSKDGRPNLDPLRDGFVKAGWLAEAGPDAAADVIQALDRMEPLMSHLRDGLDRPGSRYKANWGNDDLMPFANVFAPAKAFSIRGRALLVAGREAEALRDWRCIARIEQSVAHEPTLVSFLVRGAMSAMACALAMDGIAWGCWSDESLAEISGELARRENLAATVRHVWMSERGWINQSMERAMPASGREMADYIDSWNLQMPGLLKYPLAYAAPRGWMRQNQTLINRNFDSILDATAGTFDAQAIKRAQATALAQLSGKMIRSYWYTARTTHDLVFQLPLTRPFHFEARVAALELSCALARYRRKHGEFPADAQTLVPDFAAKLPIDPIDGKPMRYRRTGEGGCVIWSIGWNETDENGERGTNRAEVQQDDWVWQLPPLPAAAKPH